MDKTLPSKIVRILFRYSAHNLIYSVVGGYFILSLLLYMFTGINICIPCIFTLIFGRNCWGCGMSHAIMDVLQFNFAEAWHHNSLVFIVMPAGLYFIIRDFLSFLENEKSIAQK
ncbi:MAG: DUF2752 domain-containing protein [Cytophagaceae bacterium]